MKRILLSMALLLNTAGLFAQDTMYGVYGSWQNYVAGKLTYSLACNMSKDKIKLHHFFSSPYIDVIKDGHKIRLCKDSIFGYCDCKHNIYRFYKSYDEEYRIEENKTIIIYTSYLTTHDSKQRQKLVKSYFFSLTLNSPVLPLTVTNLEKAFPENSTIYNMLEAAFHNGTPVSEYDTAHNMYKINFLLKPLLNKQ